MSEFIGGNTSLPMSVFVLSFEQDNSDKSRRTLGVDQEPGERARLDAVYAQLNLQVARLIIEALDAWGHGRMSSGVLCFDCNDTIGKCVVCAMIYNANTGRIRACLPSRLLSMHGH